MKLRLLFLLFFSFFFFDCSDYKKASQNSTTLKGEFQIRNRNYITFQDFGANGFDNLEDQNAIQKAFDYAIKNNIKIKDFGGIYIIGGLKPIQFNFTKNNQSLFFEGAGEGKTIFKEDNRKTEKVGRYCKVFYHYFDKPINLNTIQLTNFSIDKNGRSNMLPKDAKHTYLFEQAHAISWAGKKNIIGSIKNLLFKNIEIVDKIGAGINFSGLSKVEKVVLDNISQKDFSGKYGQRGDIEMSAFSENIIIKNTNLEYIQIEPVGSYSSSFKNKRKTLILDSNIKNIEYTDNFGGENYNFLHIKNSKSKSLTLRNLKFLIENSEVSFSGFFNSPDGQILRSTILVSENKKGFLNSIYPTKYISQKYKTNIIFKESEIKINSLQNKIFKGFLIKNNAKIKTPNEINVLFENCKFDNRAEYLADFYANGNYTIKDSQFKSPILGGSYGIFFSEINLINNTSSHLEILNNNNNYRVNLAGKLNRKDFSIKYKTGKKESENSLIKNNLQLNN